MNLIKITDGTKTSYHTSFKKACLSYGWPYRQSLENDCTPQKVADYSIDKIETDVTIPEQKLLQFITWGPHIEWTQKTEKKQGLIVFVVTLGTDNNYVIEFSAPELLWPIKVPRDKTGLIMTLNKVIDSQGETLTISETIKSVIISAIWNLQPQQTDTKNSLK